MILIVGLALRLIIAYVLLPGSGFGADRDSFQAWAGELAAKGPSGFYDRGFFIDYTPGYLYVLWLVGIVGNALGGIGDLIKLPPILGDVVLAWLVNSFVRELGGSRRAALLGAILVLVNPVTWFDSAIWGQVDSFGVIFLLLAVRDLWRGRPERASFFAVVAAVIKPQLGILLPIMAVVLLRRHVYDRLRPPETAGATADAASAGAGSPTTVEDLPPGPRGDPWLDRLGQGPIRIVTSAGVGVVTAILLCLPFGLSLVGLLQQVVKTAGGYPYVTVNAYNPWALLTSDGNGLAQDGLWLRDVAGTKAGEVATLIAGVPAVYVGTALLLAVIAAVCVIVARLSRPSAVVVDDDLPGGPFRILTDDRRLLLVALTVMAIAFFVVPTRVHERYLFPFAILGAILGATSRRWLVAYVVLSLANFANLYAVLLIPYFENPGIKDWLGLAEAIRSALGVTLVAVVHLGVGIWAFTELRARAVFRLDREAFAETLWERVDDLEPAGEPDRAGELPAGGVVAAGAAVPGPVASDGPPPPAHWEVPATAPPITSSAGDASASAGLPLPFGLGAVRTLLPDRSRRLHGEGGGRFDRLDLWLLVVIVIAALTIRTFRLSEPYRMHFDEVYHARTATEFLQDWRYGQPHDIYEYTHPHLAKYAMAVGLIVAGDDRVTAERELGTAVRDALVEPRWEDPSLPDARAGDRFYVAGGDRVRAYDLVSRRLVADWEVPGAATLALDPTGHRLLVGTDAGTILALDTSQELDSLRAAGSASTGDAGAGPAELGSVGAPITRIALTDDGTGMAVATAEGEVVLVDPGSGNELARARFDGLADLADGGVGNGLTADPAAVPDAAAAAGALAAITGGDPADYQRRLGTTTGDGSQVVVLADIPDEEEATVQAAIDDGRLEGFAITPLPLIAVAEANGMSFVSPATGEVVDTVTLDAPARGLAKVTGIDKPTLYAALGGNQMAVVQLGEDGKTRPSLQTTFWMPGDVRRVLYDEPTGMVHVLGTAPDGSGDTIYVVEPHANAVYADARLPFAASAWALDADAGHPSGDRQAILVTSADGTLATVDAGQPRLRLAPARGDRGGAHGRPRLPPRPDPVPAPRDRGHRRDPRPRRRDALRPEPDRDERRLRRAVHRRRLHPVRATVDRSLAEPVGVLARAPARRRPPRTRTRLEVGRPVRDGRDRGAHPRPLGARPDRPDPGPRRRHDDPRLHGDGHPPRCDDQRPELRLHRADDRAHPRRRRW